MNRDSGSKSHFYKNLESPNQFFFELIQFGNLSLNLEPLMNFESPLSNESRFKKCMIGCVKLLNMDDRLRESHNLSSIFRILIQFSNLFFNLQNF